MGCGGDREEKAVKAEQKWDYFNLSDFKSSSCFTPVSYAILWIALLVSIACYAVDIFTAYNLLVFDKWSGKIQPAVKLSITRWVFAGCIILSYILLAYRFMTAHRAIKSGGVARSYLDPLAVRLQSIRMGKEGRGWRRFLVFAELTKSKKGSEYVALFAYFSFEAWLRILFAEGPRNVINGMTLYAVMNSDLIPVGDHSASAGHSPIVQFFVNVRILANGDNMGAAILLGMLFTLVIWIIAFLSLCIASILYVVFLWHHIPSQDGGLRGYLKRKIDGRVQKIIDIKVRKALAIDDRSKSREDLKLGRTGTGLSGVSRQPTLPVLGDDKLPDMPMLQRQDTQGTLPPYTSRPPTRNDWMPRLEKEPSLPNVDFGRPGMPGRSDTMSSSASYASNAPLMGSAGSMGYGAPGSQAPPRLGTPVGGPTRPFTPTGGPPRSFTPTGEPQRSYTPAGGPPGRMPGGPIRRNTDMSDASGHIMPAGPTRQNTGISDYSTGRSTPIGAPPGQNTTIGALPNGRNSPGPRGPPQRQNTDQSYHQNQRLPPLNTQGRSSPAPSSGGNSVYGRNSPAPQESYELRSQTPKSAAPRFQAYNPNSSITSSPLSGAAPALARNFTAPIRQQTQTDYYSSQKPAPTQRSGTAPVPANAGYNDSMYESYGG